MTFTISLYFNHNDYNYPHRILTRDTRILQNLPATPVCLPRPNSLAIFRSYWSYIFSICLLEIQHRRIYYFVAMASFLRCDSGLQKEDIVLSLGNPSKKLVRWLCAIFAHGKGRYATRSVPPWIVYCDQDIHTILSAELLANAFVQKRPSSFVEAAEFIFEFYALCDFGSQLTKAFLTVLLFPFHAI